MSLLELARLLLRRWPVVLIVGVLTGAAAAAALLSVEDTYTIDTALVLEPDEGDGAEQLATPLALAQALNSGDVRDDISSLGGTTSYETVADGDFVLVRATADSASLARQTVESVLGRLERELPVVAERYGPGADELRAEVVATPGVRGLTADGQTIVEASVLVIQRGRPQNRFANANYAGQLALAAVDSEISSGALGIEDPDEVDLGFDYRTPAPVISVEATSSSPAEAERLYQETVSLLRDTLDRLQDEQGIESGRRTSVSPLLSSDPTPERTPASPLRPVVFVLVLGMVLLVLSALAVDAFVERRHARRTGRDDSVDGMQEEELGAEGGRFSARARR